LTSDVTVKIGGDNLVVTEMARLPEIEQAEQQLLKKAEERETWSPKELRQEARQAMAVEVISLAFWRLLNQGELELDSDLQVRRAAAH
jgi:hypothetical protein